MDLFRIIFDWSLIILSSYVLIRTADRIIMKPGASVGNYIVLIVWVFCCLPILLDYLFGRPEYKTVYWYKPFILPMANNEVSIIYDVLILLTVYALYFYCNGREKTQKDGVVPVWNTGLSWMRPLLFLVVVSPFVYIGISGLWPYFLTYGDAGTRGMPEGSNTLVTALLLISIVAFSTWFFKKEHFDSINIVVFFTYSFAAIWVSGKRFLIALLALIYVFYYLNRDLSIRSRRRMRIVLPVLLGALIVFSAFYLVGVRPLSDTSITSLYEMLRVDFGRDDVTKYVIYHELFLGDSILDYPGESFLSALFVWVPRQLWPLKPYQHYQYLTSSILDLPISQLPAGTTPSWWDMSIANFSYIGLVFAIFGLVGLAKLADKGATVSIKATILVLIVALMTQSIDAYVSLVLLLIAQYISTIFMKRKRGTAAIFRSR